MSTTTYSVTMAELKEPPHGGMWAPNYGSPVHMQTSRFGHHGVDSNSMPSPAAAGAPYHQAQHHPGRPRNPSVDAHQYPYARYSQEEADAYDRQQTQHHHQGHPQHSLTSHHSYPNLKRPYSHTEQATPYTEMVQDLRDDGSKLSVNHDQKLLSFKRVPEKHTIVDQHGRVQVLDMSATLHGMFFLSEMPSSSPDGAVLQPELTCYRRNLFQISGSLWTPKGQLSVVSETGDPVPVASTEVTISAIESVDGHSVRLIVIPWKTPPPNSPELNPGPDQEPTSLPLIPFSDDGHLETAGECAVYPIGWRRLQFRIATANNGRRKELQQHFVLHLKVVGTLANGTKAVLAESTTAPIVVRGRSPRNFSARKEIPLLGSSAGSRGQALVETGMGIVTGPLAMKPSDKSRSLTMDLPRSAFTFTTGGPKMPPSPMTMRSNSYPATWNPTHVAPGQGSYPATTMSPADSYPQKLPLSGANNFTAEPQEMGHHTSMPAMQLSLAAPDHQQHPPIRTQYAYVPTGTSAPPQLSISTTSDSLSVPRYVDSNPRPAKSPRHGSHQSIGSTANTESSPEYRYGPPAPYNVSSVTTSAADISPHTAQPPTPYGSQGGVGAANSGAGTPSLPQVSSAAGGPTSSSSSGPHSGPGSNPPSSATVPREYFPPATTWTTSAGEAPTSVSYANGDGARPYAYPDYKPGPTSGILKTESQQQQQQHAPPPPPYSAARGSFDGMNHYSWNAT